MKAYFISGLGADYRIFEKLSLPQSFEIIHIKWPPPAKNETLETYCHKLAQSIDNNEKFILVGLSFGGIIVTELNKIIQPAYTIIISSIISAKEFSRPLRIVQKTKLYQWVPIIFLKSIPFLAHPIFGAKSQEAKNLLKNIIQDTPPSFLKWAIPQIFNWKNSGRPNNSFRIHGMKDHIFPSEYITADLFIENAGHLLVYENAKEVSDIIAQRLLQFETS